MLKADALKILGTQTAVAQAAGVSQPTVSGHLRMLRDAGLVRLEKRGNKAFHTLDEDAIRAVLNEYERAILHGTAPDDEPAP